MLSYCQVLVTIRCLTKGKLYSEWGDLHGISKSSVCIAMDRVLTSLCHRLQNISFPTSDEEIRRTKTEGFFFKCLISQCAGRSGWNFNQNSGSLRKQAKLRLWERFSRSECPGRFWRFPWGIILKSN